MHYYNGQFDGYHMILWIIGLIILGWILFKGFDHDYQGNKSEETLDILKNRFVKGEISKEEYEESRKILRTH